LALSGHCTSSHFSSQATAAPQQQGIRLINYGFRAANCQLQETHLKTTTSLLLSERVLQPRGRAQEMVSGCSSLTPQHPHELQVEDFLLISPPSAQICCGHNHLRDAKGEVIPTLLEASIGRLGRRDKGHGTDQVPRSQPTIGKAREVFPTPRARDPAGESSLQP